MALFELHVTSGHESLTRQTALPTHRRYRAYYGWFGHHCHTGLAHQHGVINMVMENITR